jgi:5-methylcytosine-specific restriction endonuclease McrA
MSDSELVTRLDTLVTQEQRLTATFLGHLSELERRDLHLAKGYSSLFAYCTQALGLSEDVAYKRVGAARYAQRFPMALGLITEGKLHLSALLLIGPHLTDANHRAWLLAAAGRSKRDVERLVASHFPKPDVRSSVRKLPTPSASREMASTAHALNDNVQSELSVRPQVPAFAAMAPTATSSATNGPPLAAPARSKTALTATNRPRIQPLSGHTYRITFTASETLKRKLERAQELCSHATAPSNLASLIERALDCLISHEEKRRFAIPPEKPKAEARAARLHEKVSNCPRSRDASRNGNRPHHVRDKRKRSRRIPAAVRRAVWQRDGGQCSFIDDSGRRCTERHWLEIDHVVAHARGGPSTLENCRLLCRGHNMHRARLAFGSDLIARAVKSRKPSHSLDSIG